MAEALMSRADARTARRKDKTGVGAYAFRVVTGSIKTSRLVRLACERHLRDLLEGPKRGVFWDASKAEHIFAFFANFLRLPNEPTQPFHLDLWQQFLVGSLFGWVGDDGFRRFRDAYIEIGKGNGKTPVAAGVGLYGLLADGEGQAEIYCVGPMAEQARICWNDARSMVENNPQLKERVQVHKSSGVLESYDGKFAVVSGESGTKDGLRVHMCIADEVHEHKEPDTLKKLRLGFKARRQPLMLEMTNAGSDKTSLAWSHHERAKRILEGAIENDEIFGLIANVDPDDRPLRDPACWVKANPGLGQIIQRSYLQSAIQGATTPQYEALILRLNFGVWTRAESPLFDMDGWARGQSPFTMDDHVGEDAWVGCDMASNQDFATAVCVFRSGDEWRAFVYVVTPEENLRDLEDRLEVPLRRWKDEGWLDVCEGDRIDPRCVRDRVMEWADHFNVLRFGFDPWNIGSLDAELRDKCGWADEVVIKVNQSYAGMSWATKEIQAEVRGGRVNCGGNPLMTWQMGNVAVKQDPSGNIRPAKDATPGGRGKIDSPVALIIAREVARQDDPDYEEDGDTLEEGLYELDI